MIGLYKDPKGENIFRKVPGATNTWGVTKESDVKSNDSEVQGLRRRIKELENEVKEKNVRALLAICQ